MTAFSPDSLPAADDPPRSVSALLLAKWERTTTMRPWTIAWSSALLYAACMHAAAGQGVFGSIFPSPASWFDSSIKFPEARPFGTDLKQLPGQRITQASML